MSVDGELGVTGEIANDIVEGAARKRNDGSALGADKMVAMAGLANDIRGMAAWLQQSRQHIDRSEDFERAINGRSPNVGHLRDELLGGERSLASQDRIDDPAAWRGHPIAVFKQDGVDVRRPELRRGRIHVKRVAQALKRAGERRAIIGNLESMEN
jgi:hypothetical protein